MKGFIKFYHPGETMHYHIRKAVCKTVWQDKVSCLLIELESTEDLDHVEEDALQNSHPHVLMTLEDFPVEKKDIKELLGQTVYIPNSIEELLDEDDEPYDVVYTNLVLDEDDLELEENEIRFYEEKGKMILHWKGKCPRFDDPDLEYIDFEAKVEL